MSYEEMTPAARAAEFLRKAIVAIPLGIVVVLLAGGLDRDFADLGYAVGGLALVYGVYALLRGLWYKVA